MSASRQDYLTPDTSQALCAVSSVRFDILRLRVIHEEVVRRLPHPRRCVLSIQKRSQAPKSASLQEGLVFPDAFGGQCRVDHKS